MAFQSWRFENAIFYFMLAAYLLAGIFAWLEGFGKEGLARRFCLGLSVLGFAANTLVLTLRVMNFEVRPVVIDPYRLINTYEFLLTFSWFTVLVHLFLARRYKFQASGTFLMPLVFGLLLYGLTVAKPASGQFASFIVYRSRWLLVYFLTSALAYGSFAISFGLGIMYLLKNYLHNTNPRGHLAQRLPGLDLLDELGYRLVLHGFSFFSASLIAGAVWNYRAWGTVWSWEPKEAWSFISWLAFVAYLHSRHLHGWRGNRSAWMTVMGFLAVLFTFIGVSYFLPGQNIFGL